MLHPTRIALFLMALCGSAAPSLAQPPAPLALNPETGVVRNARLTTGLPLGGVGTGTFQWRTDGTIGDALFTNNWNQPTGEINGSFAAIWTRVNNRSIARVLALRNAYGLPNIADLQFLGMPPQALMEFADPAVPLSVKLRAFSPIIPHDLEHSSFPGAAILFQIKNTSDAPIEVACALSWENLLGVGGTAARGVLRNRTGNRVTPLPGSDGIFGLNYAGPPLTPGTATENRLQDNATGEMALLVRPPRKEMVVTSASWNALEARPGWWDTFAQEGRVAGEAPAGAEGKTHPAGVVSVRFTLKPGDYVELPFAVSWHCPRYFTTSGIDYGHYYARVFPDARSAGRTLLQEWRPLLSLTEEWQNRLLYSSLPRWMVYRLIASVAALQTHTVHTYEGRFAPIESVGAHREASEGALAALPDRLQISSLLSAFFPRLGVRNISQAVLFQTPDGSLPTDVGNVEATLEPLTGREMRVELAGNYGRLPPPIVSPETRKAAQGEIASTCAFLVLAGRHCLLTGDREFAKRLTPPISRALGFLEKQAGAEGLPPALEQTPEPQRLRTTALWVSAWRYGMRWARLAENADLQRRLSPVLERALAGAKARFAERSWEEEETFYAALGQAEMTETLRDLLLPEAKIEAGMEKWRLWDRRRNVEQQSLWLLPTPTAPGRFALAQGIGWIGLEALLGADYDAETQRLTLTPRLPGTWRSLKAPVFKPGFWGQIEFKPRVRGGLTTFRLDRLLSAQEVSGQRRPAFGATLRIQSLRVTAPQTSALTLPNVRVSLGQTPIGHRIAFDANGALLITFESPLDMSAGDRLEADVR